MQSEKWNQARELFERVLDTQAADREAYLAAACGGDATLLAEVRELLAAHEGDSFLEGPPAHVATAAARAVDGGGPSTGAEVTVDLGATRPGRVRTGETGRTSSAVSLPPTIGRYRIVGALGRGGMGVVYRGQDPETGELVAIKTVRAASESLVSGIRREVHALARLSHPGIVRVVDEGLEGGVPWYAMELVEGTSLRAHRGPATHLLAETVVALDDEEASAPPATAGPGAAPAHDLDAVLGLVRRVCETLAFLHGEGIVHRDLKPDNILVRPSGRPVLVDFGIATAFAGRDGRDALDALAEVGGTPVYMAPEQIRGEAVDARADLYALGCILYEMVAGRPPFVGKTADDLVRAHLAAAPAPPSVFAPGLPAALDALVVRLLAKRPDERIGYASDVASALGRLGAEGETEPDGPRPRTYLYRPGFAGRVEALDTFDQILGRLAGGEGGVVLLGGESGVGKTRLALEVARRAERAGARVLAGECTPPGAKAGGAGSALHALRAPLERIADRCRERGVAETDALLGPRGLLLARYEPSLAGLPGQEKYPEPAELAPAPARLRLFEAVAATLGAFARSRPVLVVLDDLQWADELTLGAVGYLARAGHGPLLVVGTYRSEEQPEALRELLDASRATRVDLGRLEEPAVEAMVGGMLAIEPPRVLSGFLSRQSEGNPFFVAEYLRAAVDEGLLWRDEAGSWQVEGDGAGHATEGDYERLGLPLTLRALVERRLGGLGRGAAETISAAAVVGREAEANLLERVAGLGGGALLDAIEELRRRQILEPTADGRLRFTHDKLREAAYDAIAPDERVRLHGEAARALESRPAAERESLLPALGFHWELAGQVARARPFYLAGARRAKERYAHEEAERLYRAYLSLVDAPTVESVEARNELGFDVLRISGGIEKMAEEHERAVDEAERLGDRSLLAQGLLKLGRGHFLLGRLPEARTYMERALGVVHGTGDKKLEAMILNGLGAIALDLDPPEVALALFEGALACYRALGNREGESTTLGNIAIVSERRWAFSEASSVYTQALAIKQEIGDRAGQLPILLNLGNLHHVEGDITASVGYLDRCLDLASEIGDRSYEGFALIMAAHNHLVRGALDAAASAARRALDAFRMTGQRDYEGEALHVLAGLHVEEGRVDEALAAYEDVLDIHRHLRLRRSEADALLGRAILERRTGNLEFGERSAGEAEALFRESGDLVRVLLCTCERGHTRLARGGRARDLLGSVEGAASSLGARSTSELGRALARLRRAVEAFDAGRRLFQGECVEDIPERLRRALVGPEAG